MDTNGQTGTMEPWVNLNGVHYTREQTFAAYTKAMAGDVLTKDEARLAGAWCVHPLNTSQELAPYVIGSLLMSRQNVGR